MDAVDTQPMNNMESSMMATIHARVSPAEKKMCSSPPPSDVGPGKEYRKVSAGETTTKDSEKVGEKVEDSLESKAGERIFKLSKKLSMKPCSCQIP